MRRTFSLHALHWRVLRLPVRRLRARRRVIRAEVRRLARQQRAAARDVRILRRQQYDLVVAICMDDTRNEGRSEEVDENNKAEELEQAGSDDHASTSSTSKRTLRQRLAESTTRLAESTTLADGLIIENDALRARFGFYGPIRVSSSSSSTGSSSG